MTAIDLSSVKFTSPEANARAFRAVRRMTEMLPMLSGVLRAMTGDPKANVQITAEVPCTDGTRVWMRPPIELGDIIKHDRANCSKRDGKSHPVCPACAQMEMVDQTLFHELAHIVFDTFKTITDEAKAQMLQRMLDEFPNAKGTRLTNIKAQVAYVKNARPWEANYMGIASMISPFLPIIVNALEDARVNRAMYKVRAGTYHMFRSKLYYVFEEGNGQLSGTIFHWINEDENAQVIIGCLCKASGVEPREGYLSPAVLTALADPALTAEIASLETVATTAHDIYNASFRVLEHLRRLGFCRRSDDQQDDEPEQGDDDAQTDDASASGDSEETEMGDGGSSDGPSDEDSSDPTDKLSDGEQSDSSESDDNDADSELGNPTGDADEKSSDGSDEVDGESQDIDGDDTDSTSEHETENGSESGGKPTSGSDEGSQNGGTDDGDPSTDDGESSDEASSDLDNRQGTEKGSTTPSSSDDEADEVDEAAAEERMNASDPEAVARLVQVFGGHDPDAEPDDKTERELGVAIIQAATFDEASSTVLSFNTHYFDKPNDRTKKLAWRCLATQYDDDDDWYASPSEDEASEFDMPESLVGPVLLKMRTVFADNKKAKRSGELRSGRVISQRLPSVMAGNMKVFSRNQKPGRKDYFVCVAMDVSSSTTGPALHNIKLMGMAIGNLLSRSGVKFALYAHTGGNVGRSTDSSGRGQSVYEGDVFVVKDEHDKWDSRAKNRLAKLNSSGNNLDGHALEWMRKRCDQSTATDKVIFYVTDGAMPEANESDEVIILRREIATCTKKGYTLVGVGIETDSPSRHGLDTIIINEPRDIAKLVNDLGKRLAVKA